MNVNSTSLSDEQKRELGQKRLLAVLVLVLALLLGVGVFFMRRQAEAASALSRVQQMVDAQNESLKLTPEQQAHRLERVKFLRDKWRIWALQHQPELRRMLAAKADDNAALAAIWDAIPAWSEDNANGPTSADLNGTQDAAVSKGDVFSWSASEKGVQIAAPGMEKNMQKSLATQAWRLHHDFEQLRDIQIADSVQTGKVSVSLWASGRVTENTMLTVTRAEIKQGMGFKEARREILPPYDFLQGSQ